MIPARHHIALLPNPSAGADKSQRLADEICLLLEERNISYTAFRTSWPDDLSSFTQAWVVGGDGTINWFINTYTQHPPIALFAGGSGNDLHWMLFGETSLEEQVERVLNAEPQFIDGGLCNGKLFVNGLGIGFDGAIVKDLEGKRKLAGKASYLLSIMKQVVGFIERKCFLQTGEELWEQDCFMISVANGRRYGGGFLVTPEAEVSDGKLDLCVIGRISPFNRMRYLPVLERGAHLSLPITTYRQVEVVVISSKEPIPAHIDGEYLFADRFEVKVLPKHFPFLF